MTKNLVLMTAEQSKLMSNWVRDGLEIINDKHEDFHRMVIEQYPDRDYVFQQSIVMNCVCSAIIRMGIEYLKMATFRDIDIANIEKLLKNALANELAGDANHDIGTKTKQ
jgi:hypothetical protein